jgi:hypothetical protein
VIDIDAKLRMGFFWGRGGTLIYANILGVMLGVTPASLGHKFDLDRSVFYFHFCRNLAGLVGILMIFVFYASEGAERGLQWIPATAHNGISARAVPLIAIEDIAEKKILEPL